MRSVSKRALITGAGGGIGKGMALAFAKAGIHLALVDILAAECETVAAEVRDLGGCAVAIEADIGNRMDCAAAMEKAVLALGGLDILVNNAIKTRVGHSLMEHSEEDMELNWQTGAMATFRMMQLAYPHFIAAGGGSVINFGSGNGTEGLPGMTAYGATKEAIRAISKVAAHEWGRSKIRVNVICPFADSPGMNQFASEHPALFQATLDKTMLGRVGNCEKDIGSVALFLAGDASAFVTGQTLMVDGGLHGFR